MKTIIIATDFSSAALNAAEYGVDMALAINADILLFNSYQIPVGASEVPAAFDFNTMEKNAVEQMKILEEHFTLKAEGKVKIATTISFGDFFEELVKTCENASPYIVILGNKGATAAERIFFGSNALYVITHLKWPLIAVPANAKFAAIKKIALACDLHSVVNTIPAEEINVLVKDFKAELHILNIGKENKFDPETVFQSQVLERMLVGTKPYYHFIAADDVDNGIIEFSEKNDIDLVILFPKRHGLAQKLIHKSHSKQIVLHSHIPVMALR